MSRPPRLRGPPLYQPSYCSPHLPIDFMCSSHTILQPKVRAEDFEFNQHFGSRKWGDTFQR